MIADLLTRGKSIRAIAAEIGRSASTVSREIKRNNDPAAGTRYGSVPSRFHPLDVVARAAGGDDADAGGVHFPDQQHRAVGGDLLGSP